MHLHVLFVCGSRRGAEQQGAGSRMVLDPTVLVPLSSALQQLIGDNGFLSIANASNFDLVLSYVTYYRRDEVD